MSVYSDTVNALTPTAFWRLGESPGATVAVDETGNYDGTYINAPSLGEPSLLVNDPDTSVNFNGVNEFVNLNSIVSQLITHSAGGLLFNLKLNTVGDLAYASISHTGVDTRYIQFYVNETSVHMTLASVNGDQNWGVDYTFNLGEVYHILIQTHPTDFYHFTINGVLTPATLFSGTGRVTWFNDYAYNAFSIGSLQRPSASYGSSTMDEFVIFSDYVTEEEGLLLYKEATNTNYKALNITIDHTKVNDDLYDFQLLVNLGASSGIDTFDSGNIFDNLNDTIPDDLKILTAVYINPADETSIDYNAEINALNPILYWRLGESIGETITVDETGNYNGTYVNTPTLETASLLVNDSNTSVDFDVNSYSVALSAYPISTEKSLCFLFKPESFGGYKDIICVYNSTTDRLMIQTGLTGELRIYKDTVQQYISAINTFVVGNTYHMAFCDNGVSTNIYINGVLFINIGITLTDVVSGAEFIIGAYNGSGVYYPRYDGIIDEVSLFDIMLTQNNVETLYNASIDDLTPPADITIQSQECKVEIDRWDQVNQQAQLWVKVPYISKDTNTIINLSYDPTNNDNSINVGYTGDTPAQNVWTDYDGVYHLSADAGDSTINVLDGTLVGIDPTNIVDFGVGKGLTFNGTNEAINLGDNFDLRADDLIFSATLNVDAVNIGNQWFFAKSLLASLVGRWYIGVIGDKIQFNFESSASAVRTLTSVTALLPATDYTIDIIFDRNNLMSIYINGVLDVSFDWSAYTSNYDITCPALIGAYNSNPCTNIHFDTAFAGKLKEYRFNKLLKPVGWVSTNYNSTQDLLTRYSNADPYILAKFISGVITENVAVVDWIIRANRLDTGALTAELKTIAGVFNLPIPTLQWYPSVITVIPDQGVEWTGNTAQLVDDLVFPTDPETTPYYFKCTVSGTGIDGVTGLTEPTWPTIPGQTVVDGTVTWEVVERMIQPISHSPMIPK